ncbi:MAG TPA: hypothetical protein VEI73_04765 [Candidatus Acidoferrum sp.]|nr:hypothetical protein [Candidatus Acidoferrum sp.]
MPTLSLSPEQIAQVSASVAEYISSQRGHFRGRATSLSPSQQLALAGFFRPDLLAATRILVLKNERIGNPPFYPALRAIGFANLPDFAFMAAVTFCDVIVSHEPFSSGLLFHEFVHAEQYRQLSYPMRVSHPERSAAESKDLSVAIPRFADLYVRGFLAGGGYDGIPLEINAYALGARFESAPQAPFSVESEVASWINRGKF